jgi:purine-cytosine permease-like protein
MVRWCSGLLAGGLAVLLVLLAGSWVGSAAAGSAGPGGQVVLGHLVAACCAVALQRVADRRRDPVGVAASVGVFVVAGCTAVFWLS